MIQKPQVMNGVRYSTCRPSRWKYSNIRLRERFAPIAAASTKATFPKEVAHPVQYGTRLKSVAAYLNQYQLVPFDRLSETFVDLQPSFKPEYSD